MSVRVDLFHRDGLSEVARLVHVASFGNGHIVGEELQRQDSQKGNVAVACVGNLETVVAHAFHYSVAFCHDAYNLSLA